MKYLKKFNESKQPTVVDVNDVQTIGDQCFAYLYDDGYKLSVWDDDDYELIKIEFAKNNNDGLEDFNWDDVKDYFIPFFNLLKDKYNFGDGYEAIVFNRMDGYTDNIYLNDLLNDNYSGGNYIYSISTSFWKYTDVNEAKIIESENYNPFYGKNYDKIMEDIVNYTENYLSYILDDLHISYIFDNNIKTRNEPIVKMEIYYRQDAKDNKWSDAKDTFIPFFTMLSQDYGLKNSNKYNNYVVDTTSYYTFKFTDFNLNTVYIEDKYVLDDELERKIYRDCIIHNQKNKFNLENLKCIKLNVNVEKYF